MQIPEFKKLEKGPSFTGIFDGEGRHPYYLVGKHCMVVWYGGMKLGVNDNTQPKVSVLLREIQFIESGSNWGGYYIVYFNAALLSFVRLGTVWQFHEKGKAEKLYRASFDPFECRVNCKEGEYRVLKTELLEREGYLPEQKTSKYPILANWKKYFAGSHVLCFESSSKYRVLIPSLEWFSRTYGSSSELRRILLTYPWYEVEKRIYETPSETFNVPPDSWYVCISKNMIDNDAGLLAHIKYSSFAKLQAKNIHAHVTAVDRDSGGHVFPIIRPWNQNNCLVSLKV